jgi:hypothetical protein
MAAQASYISLAQRDGSRYEQYFLRGRNLRAETLYRATIGVEPMTPYEVAADYDVPVAAVVEAIHYCLHNAELLQKEREQDREETSSRGLVPLPPLSSGT